MLKTTASARVVKRTFKYINNLVVPTMGAKGRLAVIQEEFDKPTLTDDGVTVARQARHLLGFERMVAISMIEAAANTEKEAYDGTTLTILLTYELYKAGLRLCRKMHPQRAADLLEQQVAELRKELEKKHKIQMEAKYVRQVATISTKIPALGKVIEDAYQIAGPRMNVVVEHDREKQGISIDHEKGLSLDSGYMTDGMKQMCNDGNKTVFRNAHIVLFREGLMTMTMIREFFASIPQDKLKDPFVFFIRPDFNPDSMRLLIEILIQNKMIFQFVFLNEERSDDLYMDIAAVTNAKVQDMTLGTSDYRFEHCGVAEMIRVDIEKTLIVGSGDITSRKEDYERRLKDNKFKMGINEERLTIRRLSSLENGIVKIKVGVPTITEFKTLQLKLDDAIGAVKKSFETGILLGGGKALWNASKNYSVLKRALQKPLLTITNNAGCKVNRHKIKKDTVGYDVVNSRYVDLLEAGIIDSFASIDLALTNAVSIAASYLRSYTLIRQENK